MLKTTLNIGNKWALWNLLWTLLWEIWTYQENHLYSGQITHHGHSLWKNGVKNSRTYSNANLLHPQKHNSCRASFSLAYLRYMFIDGYLFQIRTSMHFPGVLPWKASLIMLVITWSKIQMQKYEIQKKSFWTIHYHGHSKSDSHSNL